MMIVFDWFVWLCTNDITMIVILGLAAAKLDDLYANRRYR